MLRPVAPDDRIYSCAQIDQVVAKVLPQFVLSCVQGPSITTNTEKLAGNRATRKQVSLTAPQTSQLGSGFSGKIGDDTFLHARAERVQAAFFHECTSTSLEKLSTICALLNNAPSRVALASGAFKKPGAVGFQPASRAEQWWQRSPCRFAPATGNLCWNVHFSFE